MFKEDFQNIINKHNEYASDFKSLVDLYASTQIARIESRLCKVLSKFQLFNELVINNALTKEDLQYLLNAINSWEVLEKFRWNKTLFYHCIDELGFQPVFNKFADLNAMTSFFHEKSLFEKFEQTEFLSREDLDVLWSRLDAWYKLRAFADSSALLRMSTKAFGFEYVIDRFNSTKYDNLDISCLHLLLSNIGLFQYLIETNQFSKNISTRIFDSISNDKDLEKLSENDLLLKHFIAQFGFKRVVDLFCSMTDSNGLSFLYLLLNRENMLQTLIQEKQISNIDLKHLLKQIRSIHELHFLCDDLHTNILSYALQNFLIDFQILKNYDKIVEKCYNEMGCSRFTQNNLRTFFDYASSFSSNNIDVFRLISLYKYLFDSTSSTLTAQQQKKLRAICKSNKEAYDRLLNIISNKLENNFDFESLMNYLKKKERKNLMSI